MKSEAQRLRAQTAVGPEGGGRGLVRCGQILLARHVSAENPSSAGPSDPIEAIEAGGTLLAGMALAKQTTRRSFAKVATAPLVVSASALGLGGATPPSDRIVVAGIGMGGRNSRNVQEFLNQEDVRVVAVCDIFAERRDRAKQLVDGHYGNADCTAMRFHEEVLERDDIDAVVIGTGDRWHSVMSSLAAQAGKDAYCEKPFCLTVAEGRQLVNVTKQYGAVWQCGTQRRSNPGYAFLVNAILSGRIGKLHTVRLSFGAGGNWKVNSFARPEKPPDPAIFDYDRWLGQAPWAPYSEDRVRLWRLNWDTGAGAIADMGPHFIETVQWLRGDPLDAPVEYEGLAEYRTEGGINNIPYWYEVRARYRDGLRLHMDTGPKGLRFMGDEGWIFLSDTGGMEARPGSVLDGLDPPDANYIIQAPHVRNFLDSIRSRRPPVSNPESAQRSHTIAHCANICLRLGRRVRWDSAEERFVGDGEANNMMYRAMRPPWKV